MGIGDHPDVLETRTPDGSWRRQPTYSPVNVNPRCLFHSNWWTTRECSEQCSPITTNASNNYSHSAHALYNVISWTITHCFSTIILCVNATHAALLRHNNHLSQWHKTNFQFFGQVSSTEPIEGESSCLTSICLPCYSDRDRSLTVMYFNARSLLPNLDELRILAHLYCWNLAFPRHYQWGNLDSWLPSAQKG